MGELSNPRHERFAQELVAGRSADAAYEVAGYRKHRSNAARLSANEHVKERVSEIQAIGAERAAVTVHSLIEEAEQARIKAMESANGAAAAVSAITAKVPTMETGTAISGMSVARQVCKKIRTTIPTRMMASRSAMKTSWIDWSMNGVVS